MRRYVGVALLILAGTGVMRAYQDVPGLLWDYMTDQERKLYSSYEHFKGQYELSQSLLQIKGFISDSLYTVGRGPGNYNFSAIWDGAVYRDTLFLGIFGFDHIAKFTSDGRFVASLGARPTLYYLHGIGINDRYIWISQGDGGHPKKWIVSRTHPATIIDVDDSTPYRFIRIALDSTDVYCLVHDYFNSDHGELYMFPDSSVDPSDVIFTIEHDFKGVDVDNLYLWLVDSDSLYRYRKNPGNPPSLEASAFIAHNLIDVVAGYNRVFVARKASDDSMTVFIIDKNSLEPVSSFNTAFLPANYMTMASLEMIGDTLYVMKRVDRRACEHSWAVERFLIQNDTAISLDQFGDEFPMETYAPEQTILRDGYWISSNSYEWLKITIRKPDGIFEKQIDLPYHSVGIEYDPQRGYFYLGLTVPDGSGNLAIVDTSGNIIGTALSNSSWIHDIHLWHDTLFVKASASSYIHVMNPENLETYRVFFVNQGVGSPGMDIAGDSGFIFVTAKIDGRSGVKVFRRDGSHVADIAIYNTMVHYYDVSVDDRVFPWRVFVSPNTSGVSPLLICEVNPLTWDWEFVDSVGAPLFRSVMYPYWEWLPSIDTLYLENPENFIIAVGEPAGSKVLMTDIHNRRTIVHPLKVNHRSDTPLATAYQGQRHLVRVPNSDFLHLVYESQGNIYYHTSPDGGVTWNPPKIIEGGEYPSLLQNYGEGKVTGIVYVKDGQLRYAQVDPDYIAYNTVTLWTEESDIAFPVVTKVWREDTRFIHVVYEGRKNGTLCLSYASYMIPIYPDSPVTIMPGRHELIAYLNEPGSHPSLTSDMYLFHLHVVWQNQGKIFYSEYNNGEWMPPVEIEIVAWGTAESPDITAYGEKIYVNFVQDSTSNGIYERLVRRIRDLSDTLPYWWWEFPEDTLISSADLRNATLSLTGRYSFFAMNETPCTPTPTWEIYYYDWATGDMKNISQSPSVDSKYPAASSMELNDMSRWYCIWTEGNAPPYEIMGKNANNKSRRQICSLAGPVTLYPLPGPFPLTVDTSLSYYSARLGDTIPSPFTHYRSGYINTWDIPVDYGNDYLIYIFPNIDPIYNYYIGVKFYQEAADVRNARIYAGNELLGEVSYNYETPRVAFFRVPPQTYSDSSITISLENLGSAMVTAAEVRLYRFERWIWTPWGGPLSSEVTRANQSPSFSIKPSIFRERTEISFSLPENEKVELSVYDESGRKVRNIHSGLMLKGDHTLLWDGRDSHGKKVAGGIYFFRLRTRNDEIVEKALLLR